MKKIVKSASKIIFAIVTIIALYLVYHIVPYALASYQYGNLIDKNNLSKNQVENILFLYSSQEIPINESLWGKAITLKKGEECWQYRILWIEPIDIVYSDQGHVVKIYSSFE